MDEPGRLSSTTLCHRCEIRFQHCGEPVRRTHRFFLSNSASAFVEANPKQLLCVERCLTGQQLVQQHAQRINVAASVDVQAAHLGLLRAHVCWGADELFESSKNSEIRQPLMGGGLCDPKIDHLWDGCA